MDESKSAKKVYTLDEIKYNPENLAMGVVACIPFVGLVLMFVEKKDLFVRYHATQFAFFNLVPFLGIIPILGPLIASMGGLVSLVFFVLGLMKTSKGERFDIPFLSEYALKVMGQIG